MAQKSKTVQQSRNLRWSGGWHVVSRAHLYWMSATAAASSFHQGQGRVLKWRDLGKWMQFAKVKVSPWQLTLTTYELPVTTTFFGFRSSSISTFGPLLSYHLWSSSLISHHHSTFPTPRVGDHYSLHLSFSFLKALPCTTFEITSIYIIILLLNFYFVHLTFVHKFVWLFNCAHFNIKLHQYNDEQYPTGFSSLKQHSIGWLRYRQRRQERMIMASINI